MKRFHCLNIIYSSTCLYRQFSRNVISSDYVQYSANNHYKCSLDFKLKPYMSVFTKVYLKYIILYLSHKYYKVIDCKYNEFENYSVYCKSGKVTKLKSE